MQNCINLVKLCVVIQCDGRELQQSAEQHPVPRQRKTFQFTNVCLLLLLYGQELLCVLAWKGLGERCAHLRIKYKVQVMPPFSSSRFHFLFPKIELVSLWGQSALRCSSRSPLAQQLGKSRSVDQQLVSRRGKWQFRQQKTRTMCEYFVVLQIYSLANLTWKFKKVNECEDCHYTLKAKATRGVPNFESTGIGSIPKLIESSF